MQAVGWTKISANAQSRHYGFATFSAIVKRTTAAWSAGFVRTRISFASRPQRKYFPALLQELAGQIDHCVHVGAAAARTQVLLLILLSP